MKKLLSSSGLNTPIPRLDIVSTEHSRSGLTHCPCPVFWDEHNLQAVALISIDVFGVPQLREYCNKEMSQMSQTFSCVKLLFNLAVNMLDVEKQEIPFLSI